MLGTLTNEQMTSVLSSQVIGRLACTDGMQPYIVPVTYVFDGEYILGQANEGEKLRILRKNNLVCFEVERITHLRNWESVLVYGNFEELKGEESEEAREKLFGKVLPLMTESVIHGHEHEVTGRLDDSNRVKSIMYRIKITSLSGRFENNFL